MTSSVSISRKRLLEDKEGCMTSSSVLLRKLFTYQISWVDQTKLSDATETCSLSYGVALDVQDISIYQSSRVKKTTSIVTVPDRTNDKEAYVLSLPEENSIPLSKLIVPN